MRQPRNSWLALSRYYRCLQWLSKQQIMVSRVCLTLFFPNQLAAKWLKFIHEIWNLLLRVKCLHCFYSWYKLSNVVLPHKHIGYWPFKKCSVQTPWFNMKYVNIGKKLHSLNQFIKSVKRQNISLEIQSINQLEKVNSH